MRDDGDTDDGRVTCQHPNVYIHEPVPSIRICADCGKDLSAMQDRVT